ncbi:hypothetical protein VNO78_09281 [Psophocarpus tetragonolobus]|uniref:Uncharacterized protein n=1 Tax=Psophocarpus tetragonolobus TaxID=3891 RepID=A0AAN9XTY3_PSOTE
MGAHETTEQPFTNTDGAVERVISNEGKFSDQTLQHSFVDRTRILYSTTHLPSIRPIENHSPLSLSVVVEQTISTPPISSCTTSHHQTSPWVRPEPNFVEVSGEDDVLGSPVNPISTCSRNNLGFAGHEPNSNSFSFYNCSHKSFNRG